MTGAGHGFDGRDDQEAWLRRFEDEWKAGSTPALDAFLPTLSPRWQNDPALRDLVVELIAIDLEYRFRRGDEACLEDYCGRHSLGAMEALPLELPVAEYEARCLAGKPPEIESFLAQLPGRADSLRPLIAQSAGRGDSDGAR